MFLVLLVFKLEGGFASELRFVALDRRMMSGLQTGLLLGLASSDSLSLMVLDFLVLLVGGVVDDCHFTDQTSSESGFSIGDFLVLWIGEVVVETYLVDLVLTGSGVAIGSLSLTHGCFSVLVTDGVADCSHLVGWIVLDGLGLVFHFTSSWL